MKTSPEVPSHLDLVDAARSVQRLAAYRETEPLHDEVCQLRNALVEHIHDERRTSCSHDDLHGQLVRRGQDDLLRFIDKLLTTTTDHDEHCACLIRAADLRLKLLRQIQLETRHSRNR